MSGLIEIKTNRLLLRQWRLNDFQFFSKINASKVVMKYFTNTLTQAQSNQLAITIQQRILENGWGLWAVEIPNVCEFIGFVGLNRPTYPLPFSPCVEIGWRLDEKYWGKGFATEAAQSVLSVGFNQLELPEIVAFTSVLNTPSEKLMQRLNMQNDNTVFAHPKIPLGHELQDHVLYKISRDNWLPKNTISQL